MKKRFVTNKRGVVAGILLFLLAFVAGLVPGAAPVEAGVRSSTIRLTISFPVDGADFSLFKVGETDEENHFRLVGRFAESMLEASGAVVKGSAVETTDPDPFSMMLSGDETTLAGYARAGDEIAHIQANMATELTLDDGLYLVTGTAVTENGTTYTPVSFYLSFPSYDSEGKEEAEIKVESKYIQNQGSPKELRVVKLWAGDGDAGKRPEEIRVEVLCDGTVETVLTLGEENNWSAVYTPEGNGTYTVREQNVPEGYRVSVAQDEEGFVLTNTWEPEPSVTPTVTPAPEETPTEVPTLTPTVEVTKPGTSVTTSEVVKTGDETKLSLWIVLLMLSSTGMIILGAIKRIRGERD